MKWRVTHIPVVSFLARRKAYPYLSSLIAVGQLLHLISSSDSQFLPAGSSHISLMLPEFRVYSSVSNIPPKKKLQICMFLQCACLTFFSCFQFFGTRALTLPRQGPRLCLFPQPLLSPFTTCTSVSSTYFSKTLLLNFRPKSIS